MLFLLTHRRPSFRHPVGPEGRRPPGGHCHRRSGRKKPSPGSGRRIPDGHERVPSGARQERSSAAGQVRPRRLREPRARESRRGLRRDPGQPSGARMVTLIRGNGVHMRNVCCTEYPGSTAFTGSAFPWPTMTYASQTHPIYSESTWVLCCSACW